ncbi:MAG: hypothetical protein ACWM1A_03600 [Staphylococcus epidermidis]
MSEFIEFSIGNCFYNYKLRKQPNEKPHKTAIIACINRLLKTIHYLVMNHKLYDYQMSPH